MASLVSKVKGALMGLTIRKLLIGVAVLFGLKIVWHFLHPTPINKPNLQEMADTPDYLLKQHGCTNDKCKLEGVKLTDDPIAFRRGLFTHGGQFYLDGQPFRILGGSFHYFRTLPEQWMDRLLKMKAAGLNTVTTYIAWNFHEKTRLEYNFSGRHDVASFIRQAHSIGLYVIVRAGPYICAEWDLGGLPAWLLHEKDITFRSSKSAEYLRYIEQYFSRLLPVLRPLTHGNGGPIIAFQIENEFGSLKRRDDKYLQFLIDQHRSYGLNELLLTSDGGKTQATGSMPGVLATVNFAHHPADNLEHLRQFQPGKPLMVTEFWSGWFDHWGEKHHAFTAEDTVNRVRAIIGDYNASINFYMFTGGTNFAFFNGANNSSATYQPTITSYDYNAPISECGDVTEKYMAIRRLLIELKLAPVDLPEVPRNPEKVAYSPVTLTDVMSFENLITVSTKLYGEIFLETPTFMELLTHNSGFGQNYGYILYRTTNVGRHNKLVLNGLLHDEKLLYCNGKRVELSNRRSSEFTCDLTASSTDGQPNNVVDILVENLGRVNFRRAEDYSRMFESQLKGFHGWVGGVKDDDSVVSISAKWQHVPMEFDKKFYGALSNSDLWTATDKLISGNAQPVVLRGFFELSGEPKDTFLHMTDWYRGIVYVNGFNIGRYWKVGPQRTLYVPWPLLQKGRNEIMIFSLGYAKKNIVQFTAQPVL